MPAYVLEFLISILQPIVAALGIWAVAEAIRWIRAHVSHTQSRDALERLVAAVGAAVGETEQVYVSTLKKMATDGKLTAEEHATARTEALSKAKELLGPKGLAAARGVLGNDEGAIDKWLVALIEQRIAEAKGSK